MHGSSHSYLNWLLHPCSPSRGLHFTPPPILTYSRPNNMQSFHIFSYFVPHIILELTPPWSQALFSQLGFCLSLNTKLKTFLYSQYIHGPQLKPASTFLTRVCLCACSCMCQCECEGMCITNVPMLLIQNHSGGDSLALYSF